MYRSYTGLDHKQRFFVFFSKAGPRDSFLFRSVHDQGTSGRWTDSHGAIEFRTSTGGFLGWIFGVDDRCWETGVMEPIGFSMCPTPSLPTVPCPWVDFLFWGGSFPFFLKSDFWSVCVSFFCCMCFVCLICLFFVVDYVNPGFGGCSYIQGIWDHKSSWVFHG